MTHATASYIEFGNTNEHMRADGDLRIVDTLERNGFITGALQVFIDGAFGAVCTSSFDPVDADVACRQLGFLGGTALPLAIDRRASIPPPPVRLIMMMGYLSTTGEGLVEQNSCSTNIVHSKCFIHVLETVYRTCCMRKA